MTFRAPRTHISCIIFSNLAILFGLAALVGCWTVPAEARTRKGDPFMAQGQARALKKDWDGALEFYNKALVEDPSDPGYQLSVYQARFQASQVHIMQGMKLRKEG